MTPSIARIWARGNAEIELLGTTVLQRLRSRRGALTVGAVLTAGYVVTGLLHWSAGLTGLLGLGLWAWLRPGESGSTLVPGPADPVIPAPLDGSPTAVAGRAANNGEAIWRAMLAGLPDAALMLDRKGIVLAANMRAHETMSAVSARHLSQVSRAPELLAAVDRALASAEPQSCQTRMRVPVERLVLGLVVPIVPTSSGDGRPALLVILRDLTEQDQLARMRADFVANASHELRTPLASLKGFIETLQGPARNDPQARDRFLQIMLEQAGRMSRLIEDLLSLSRIEMHEHIAPSAELDLRELVGTATRGLEPLAKTAGITLAAAPPAPEAGGCMVIGDRDELLQVVMNLMQNAIKYGVRGGRVDVALKPDGARVALVIADTGIGIAPEHLPRLTERFYRVSAKDSRERGGTGLGLAIVKHIVNHHRGELRITSRLGAGSVFTVLLPRARAAAPQVAAQ